MKLLTLTIVGAAACLIATAQAAEKKAGAVAKDQPAQSTSNAVVDGKIELQVKGMT